MTENIKILDKEFEIFLKEEQILDAVAEIAKIINKDLAGKLPVFLGILNGCFMFASDLFKNIEIDCSISFLKLASYSGTSSTGKINKLIGLNESIEGKTVVILEDIVDTGITLEHLINDLKKYNPADIKIATLLFKPEAYKKSIKIDYCAIEIPNKFIIGYGLDYDGLGRNLKHIYQIK
ncbi:MAG: hypoxanthine phosphoribosyltransferase [Bacteroidales bacterium]|nr:hypoxanthine phosphoribosyltransferase [Bacteroidales bacterium]MDD4235517.1 hypoxanthine phosphoribosyltransferase [Bacteroidales bacterium]